MLVQDAVAFAGGIFQAGAILNFRAAALVSETRFLQDARGDGNARAACVQDHRERFSRTTAIPKYSPYIIPLIYDLTILYGGIHLVKARPRRDPLDD